MNRPTCASTYRNTCATPPPGTVNTVVTVESTAPLIQCYTRCYPPTPLIQCYTRCYPPTPLIQCYTRCYPPTPLIQCYTRCYPPTPLIQCYTRCYPPTCSPCCPCPFGGYVPLLARVCWVRVVGVRTAHASILLYAFLLFVAFFLRLSLEQQQ